MFHKVLFVCVGNICRSPAAEYFAKATLQKAGHSDIHLSSAGLGAMVSSPIAPEMKILLDKLTIDSSAHRATQITQEHINDTDIIFVMETWQKQELSFAFPNSRGKIFCLGKMMDEEIIDPYRKDQATFESVFQMIQKNWMLWQKKLWNC